MKTKKRNYYQLWAYQKESEWITFWWSIQDQTQNHWHPCCPVAGFAIGEVDHVI